MHSHQEHRIRRFTVKSRRDRLAQRNTRRDGTTLEKRPKHSSAGRERLLVRDFQAVLVSLLCPARVEIAPSLPRPSSDSQHRSLRGSATLEGPVIVQCIDQLWQLPEESGAVSSSDSTRKNIPAQTSKLDPGAANLDKLLGVYPRNYAHAPSATRIRQRKSLRHLLILTVALVVSVGSMAQTNAQTKKPNILVIWGDDIGQFNISAYNMGMMGDETPSIDRIAREGAVFTDWYGQQGCNCRPRGVHHRQVSHLHRTYQRRIVGCSRGHSKRRPEDRGPAQTAWLHDGPIRQESFGRPR